MKKVVRNCFVFLLVGIMFFTSIGSVYAKTLTINEIKNKFNSSELIIFLNSLEENKIEAKVNDKASTLDIYSSDQKLFSFNYTNEYIEYSNRNAIVTKESAEEDMFTALWVTTIVDSIFELSGYTNISIFTDNKNYVDLYDTYGIQLETEPYSYSGQENGASWSISGDFIKYFKMSFDTNKIDALVNTYGVESSSEDPNESVLAALTPTLEAKKITENSITLYPHINYIKTDSDINAYCYVYRSTSKDGDYEKISDAAVNCLDNVGIIDDGLNSNTTYYYKAILMNGTKYSDVLEVTTKSPSVEEKIENPKTGVFFPTTALIIMITSFMTFICIRKRNVFKTL